MTAPNIDYYTLLRVQPTASLEQIRAAYLRQIGHWHPDRNPSEEATRRTAQINAAWEVLQDPGRRAAYDRERRRTGGTPASRRRPGSDGSTRAPRPSTVDPAAAERARRGAEASARAAEERRRREAEYEQRRKASERLWQSPPESGLGWADRQFVIGHWYRNNRGPYRMIDLRGKYADIYYADGEIVTMPVDDLWQHWQRQVQRRAGIGRSGRRAPRTYR